MHARRMHPAQRRRPSARRRPKARVGRSFSTTLAGQKRPSFQDSTMTIERRNVGKRLSDLVIYAPPPGGRLVYLAGQVAEDPNADITAQVRSVLKQIDRLLGEAASDKTRILSTTIYLADMKDYAAMNAVWDAWVPQGETPARATVEARLANPAYRVEMQVVATAG